MAIQLINIGQIANDGNGGRGTYPNGPYVLAINVRKVAATKANVVLRWGEAQA